MTCALTRCQTGIGRDTTSQIRQISRRRDFQHGSSCCGIRYRNRYGYFSNYIHIGLKQYFTISTCRDIVCAPARGSKSHCRQGVLTIRKRDGTNGTVQVGTPVAIRHHQTIAAAQGHGAGSASRSGGAIGGVQKGTGHTRVDRDGDTCIIVHSGSVISACQESAAEQCKQEEKKERLGAASSVVLKHGKVML